MKMPVGSKVGIPIEQLAQGLKGHRFLGRITGQSGMESSLVMITGEVIDGQVEAIVVVEQ